jgi:hypothetical protein
MFGRVILETLNLLESQMALAEAGAEMMAQEAQKDHNSAI